MGPELMENMRAQAERFGAELVTDDVSAVDLTGTVKTVTDSEGNTYSAYAVILAMGSAYRELACPTRSASPGTASAGAPRATASSSATRTSRSSEAATRPWRRPPSSPSSPAP